jgi:tRNA(Ile)-lysidine synthase
VKQSFLDYLEQKKLCTSHDKILLAVSGGLDSMVMLHLFNECRFTVSVAHANFLLRGKESNSDENFVESFCKKSSIPFYSRRIETELYARQNHLSIQMAARETRYQWFSELAEMYHFHYIATAHHLNDSLESVLLNLVRGSGLEGWDGIEPKNGNIIHPMLFATRRQIEAYAKESKIAWREDSSNASDDYQRNFIRHRVIPLLRELNPSLETSFSDGVAKISGAVELELLGIRYWKEKFEKKKRNQILFEKKGLNQFINPENVLWSLIKGFGFNVDQCRQIVSSLHGQSGKKFLSSNFELLIDREFLIISKHSEVSDEVLIDKGQSQAALGNLALKIEEKIQGGAKADPNFASLDAQKLKFPLRWRTWRAGDDFYPLGMSHRKKVSDFLIDQKISLVDKKSVTVLESGNEIVWLVGLRLDERYKISEMTLSTVHCQLTIVD